MRAGRVPVRANRRDAHRDLFALAVEHHAFSRHAHGASDHFPGIVDDGARLAARGQRSVRFVRAVGKTFGGHRETSSLTGAKELGAWEPEEQQGPVERGDGARDRVGQRPVADRHVVQRTVSLDVLEPDALGTREGLERADLVQDEVLDLRRRHAHRAAAKSDQIRKARVRANRNAVVASEAYCSPHDLRVAGVIPAGDVARGDVLHERGILAERPPPERFAQVTVEIDGGHGCQKLHSALGARDSGSLRSRQCDETSVSILTTVGPSASAR